MLEEAGEVKGLVEEDFPVRQNVSDVVRKKDKGYFEILKSIEAFKQKKRAADAVM